MARLDEIVVQLVTEVSSKTAERARAHYDRVKSGPVHWVPSVEHARKIAFYLRRPLLVVDENGALPDEIFAENEALRRIATRYVCVRVKRADAATEALLAKVEPNDRRRQPRLLLCPETTFRGGFDATAPLEDLVAEMEKQCAIVTEYWRRKRW
jgi:hypothetical protein